jgi:hypothetical protein
LLTALLSRIGGCRRPGLTSALPSISLEFDLDKARQILPLAVIYVLMMATNNLCLHYVQVSFYQVATALPSNPPPRLTFDSDIFISVGRLLDHSQYSSRLPSLPSSCEPGRQSWLASPFHRPLTS